MNAIHRIGVAVVGAAAIVGGVAAQTMKILSLIHI